MPETLASSSFKSASRPHRHFAHLTAGPPDGPLLIFIHGWPDMALTWRPQLLCFAALGYRCAAMDTLGYGGSATPQEDAEYCTEELVKDQLEFLEHLQADKAAWVAHDWGCGILWSLVAHYPEKCVAVASLGIPYRALELGLDFLKTTINRDIYPEAEYPNGQWDYQVWYEQKGHEGSTKQFDTMPEQFLRLTYAKGGKDSVGKPARTSEVVKAKGWFGGRDPSQLPDLPLSMTAWDGNEDIYDAMAESLKKTGFHGATSYYLNHARNAEYNRMDNTVNKGVLTMPVLLIDALYDGVCTEVGNVAAYKWTRELCKDLTETKVEAAHWSRLEKPREINATMAKWLVQKVPAWWPKEQTRGEWAKEMKL